MRTRVKICCIASVDEARMAVEAGADAIGLVSAMPSGPGVIPEPLIAEIAAATPPPVATFLLTCLTDADAIVEQHARCRTSTLQLVDSLEDGEVAKLRRALPQTKIVQVVHVLDAGSVDDAVRIAPQVDAVLLDSGNPSLAIKELGGTGRCHNWEFSRTIRERSGAPIFLAGGLHPGNVAEAVATVRPFGLDVCSGVRSEGRLDAAKLEAFIEAVRRADAGE